MEAEVARTCAVVGAAVVEAYIDGVSPVTPENEITAKFHAGVVNVPIDNAVAIPRFVTDTPADLDINDIYLAVLAILNRYPFAKVRSLKSNTAPSAAGLIHKVIVNAPHK